MKILKLKNIKNKFKEKCINCNSKILLEDGDWEFDWKAERDYFKCPVCKEEQYISVKNQKKINIMDYNTKI